MATGHINITPLVSRPPSLRTDNVAKKLLGYSACVSFNKELTMRGTEYVRTNRSSKKITHHI